MSSAFVADPAANIAAGLSKMGLALRNHAWEERGRTGLTPTQAQLVAVLFRRGPTSVGVLAELLAISQPTVSDAASTLVEKGLATKVPGSDRRTQHVTLTAEGHELAPSVSEWPDALLEAVHALAPEDQAAFLRGLTSMILELQRAGRIPLLRMCATCRFFRPNVHPDGEHPHHCAFVDAPFGDRELRLDCADHEPATTREAA